MSWDQWNQQHKGQSKGSVKLPGTHDSVHPDNLSQSGALHTHVSGPTPQVGGGNLAKQAAKATRFADDVTAAADGVLSGDSNSENEDGNMPRDQIAVALEAHQNAAKLHTQAGNKAKAAEHKAVAKELHKALKDYDADN